jgi:hypothetical protein
MPTKIGQNTQNVVPYLAARGLDAAGTRNTMRLVKRYRVKVGRIPRYGL